MSINIKPNGIVEVRRETENGVWRTTIDPGDYTRANELLSAEEWLLVNKKWTSKVLAAWQAHIEAESAA